MPHDRKTPIQLKAWVMTISDRCSSGKAEDRSGPLAVTLLKDAAITTVHQQCIPDEIDQIQAGINSALAQDVHLIFTTGGTGVAPRDCTPEATSPFILQRLNGIEDAIRRKGEPNVPTALISRGLVGIAQGANHRAVIVNAPGSPGGVKDAIAVITPLLPHLIDQLNGGDH